MAEGARLESVYALIAYRGFESLEVGSAKLEIKGDIEVTHNQTVGCNKVFQYRLE